MNALPQLGELEGLESSWDSPGMGARRVVFQRLPEVGGTFECHFSTGGRFQTTRVARLRWFARNEVRFMTRNSTYVLRIADVDSEDEVR